MSVYPTTPAGRDRFVLDRRPAKAPVEAWRHHGVVVDREPVRSGTSADVAAVFLAGSECPWRCLMCDLWRGTTDTPTPAGAIPAQVAAAVDDIRAHGPGITRIKLYNAGSFFDARAVPVSDYPTIAGALVGFDHVIVESHPSLVGARTAQFVDALAGNGGRPHRALEVAMGLETIHPVALDGLNKRMSIEDFARASDRLRGMGIARRVFLLVHPPLVPHAEQDEWLCRSIAFALSCGAGVISLIPTRLGNGAMDTLAADGLVAPPILADLERSLALGLGVASRGGGSAIVLADLWDLERFADCVHCLPARRGRLERMNLHQAVLADVTCPRCGHGGAA